MSPPPGYIDERLNLYKKLKAEHDALMAERAAKDSRPIKVTLPDGKVVEAESWKTTPYQVACGIRSVYDEIAILCDTVVAYQIWHLTFL